MHCGKMFISNTFFSGLGGWYSYRMSKAALNMATRNLSIELGRSRPKVSVFIHAALMSWCMLNHQVKEIPKS